MPEVEQIYYDLSKVEFIATKGSGPGGQHRNKSETAIIAKYNGITVKAQSYKSQKQNRELALSILNSKLYLAEQERLNKNVNTLRASQIGTGQRGDKRRTIRTQDNLVKDEDGRQWKWSNYKRGYF